MKSKHVYVFHSSIASRITLCSISSVDTRTALDYSSNGGVVVVVVEGESGCCDGCYLYVSAIYTRVCTFRGSPVFLKSLPLKLYDAFNLCLCFSERHTNTDTHTT